MNNLWIRAITGAVFLLVMIGSVVIGGYALLTIFSVIVFFSLKEYFKLIRNFSQPMEIGAIAVYVTGFVGIQFLPEALFLPFQFSMVIPLIIAEMMRKNDHQIVHAITVSFPLFWIVIPMSLLVRMGFHPIQTLQSWKVVLPFFILLWVNDTFAYLSGTLWGKHKLAPCISAGKTIEGTLGGFLFTLIAAYLIYQWIGIFPLWKWLITATIMTPIAVASDLFESILKRKAGVKDSGNILPGHGGMLDRFDSVFFTAPIYYLITHW